MNVLGIEDSVAESKRTMERVVARVKARDEIIRAAMRGYDQGVLRCRVESANCHCVMCDIEHGVESLREVEGWSV